MCFNVHTSAAAVQHQLFYFKAVHMICMSEFCHGLLTGSTLYYSIGAAGLQFVIIVGWCSFQNPALCDVEAHLCYISKSYSTVDGIWFWQCKWPCRFHCEQLQVCRRVTWPFKGPY
jgi:hypothetical protein